MSEANFDIYKIINNPNTQVTLHCFGPQEVEIKGFLTNDTFPLQGNAQYDDLSDFTVDFGKIGNWALGPVGEMAGRVGNLVRQGSNISKRPAFTTLAYWNNTEKPQFNVDLLFVRYSMTQVPNTNPLHCARELVSRCFPIKPGEGDSLWTGITSKLSSTIREGASWLEKWGISGAESGVTKTLNSMSNSIDNISNLGFLAAPNSYNPIDAIGGQIKDNPFGTSRNKTNGTWSLKIGQWFHAYNLILQNAQFEASKEVAPDGTPIYVQGSIQLESCILITYDVYKSWFVKT